jgi:serine/threonine-protein kinase RsbW
MDPAEELISQPGMPRGTFVGRAATTEVPTAASGLGEPSLRGPTSQPQLTWSRSFPGRADQVRAARAFLKEVMDGFSRVDDALLCLSELAANAVLHSASRHPGKRFTVCVNVYPGYLRIQVADHGGLWTPERGGNGQRGRGLLIVGQLARCWGIEGDRQAGWTVWFEMDCPVSDPVGKPMSPLEPSHLGSRPPGSTCERGHCD